MAKATTHKPEPQIYNRQIYHSQIDDPQIYSESQVAGANKRRILA